MRTAIADGDYRLAPRSTPAGVGDVVARRTRGRRHRTTLRGSLGRPAALTTTEPTDRRPPLLPGRKTALRPAEGARPDLEASRTGRNIQPQTKRNFFRTTSAPLRTDRGHASYLDTTPSRNFGWSRVYSGQLVQSARWLSPRAPAPPWRALGISSRSPDRPSHALPSDVRADPSPQHMQRGFSRVVCVRVAQRL